MVQIWVWNFVLFTGTWQQAGAENCATVERILLWCHKGHKASQESLLEAANKALSVNDADY